MNVTKKKQKERGGSKVMNGDIVLKPGDVVYQTDGIRIYKITVKKIIYDTETIAFDETAIGKSIFLSKEDLKNAYPCLQEAK